MAAEKILKNKKNIIKGLGIGKEKKRVDIPNGALEFSAHFFQVGRRITHFFAPMRDRELRKKKKSLSLENAKIERF